MQANYSRDIIELVDQCLMFKPSDRPSFSRIVKRIEECIDENGANRAQNMRILDRGSLQAHPRDLLAYRPADRYAMGMAVGDLPGDRGQ